MTPSEYQKLAVLTENQRFPEIANRAEDAGVLLKLIVEFRRAIVMAQRLDILKKMIFYGRDFFPMPEEGVDRRKLGLLGPTTRISEVQVLRLMHASLGLMTEAGELMEMLLKYLEGNGELDIVNAKEELGDAQWYVAAGVDACAADLEEVMDTNIKKLEARYPERFTEKDALLRNLEEERRILEGGGDGSGSDTEK